MYRFSEQEDKTFQKPQAMFPFTKTYENISVEEFRKLMDEPGTVMIDVRTKQEFDEFHLQGARHIDIFSNDFVDRLRKLDRDKTYLLYCRSGSRSGKACKVMDKLGFENPLNLKGGLIAWSRSQR